MVLVVLRYGMRVILLKMQTSLLTILVDWCCNYRAGDLRSCFLDSQWHRLSLYNVWRREYQERTFPSNNENARSSNHVALCGFPSLLCG